MQLQRYPNGGFVCHRIKLNGYNCKFSVWFDREGKLVDSERIDNLGRSNNCSNAVKALLQVVGNRHKHTPIPPN